MQFLEVSWPLWGVKIDPQTAPGEVQITPSTVLGVSWRSLANSGGLLGTPGELQEPAWRRLRPKWLPFGDPFGVTFWDTF